MEHPENKIFFSTSRMQQAAGSVFSFFNLSQSRKYSLLPGLCFNVLSCLVF